MQQKLTDFELKNGESTGKGVNGEREKVIWKRNGEFCEPWKKGLKEVFVCVKEKEKEKGEDLSDLPEMEIISIG